MEFVLNADSLEFFNFFFQHTTMIQVFNIYNLIIEIPSNYLFKYAENVIEELMNPLVRAVYGTLQEKKNKCHFKQAWLMQSSQDYSSPRWLSTAI